MPDRTRTKYQLSEGGTDAIYGNSVNQGSVITGSDSIHDLDGYSFWQYLDIAHWKFTGGRINQQGGFFSNTTSNWLMASPERWRGHTDAAQPEDGALATQMMARTNPSKPVVDVPLNIIELGDAVKLLQSLGNTAAKKIAGTYINYKFGIAPLVSDLAKLININQFIEERVKQLKKMQGPKAGSKVKLGTLSGTSTETGVVFESATGLISGQVDSSMTSEISGYIQWIPDSLPAISGNDAQLRALATRAVLGLEANFNTAWEAIPFSWLIDYFTNIGMYLDTTRNVVGAHPNATNMCIMRHTKTVHKGSSENPRISDFTSEFETKSRRSAWPSITANFGLLNAGQMSIISSLYVLQRKAGR